VPATPEVAAAIEGGASGFFPPPEKKAQSFLLTPHLHFWQNRSRVRVLLRARQNEQPELSSPAGNQKRPKQ